MADEIRAEMVANVWKVVAAAGAEVEAPRRVGPSELAQHQPSQVAAAGEEESIDPLEVAQRALGLGGRHAAVELLGLLLDVGSRLRARGC